MLARLLREPAVADALRQTLGPGAPADTLVPHAEAEIEIKAARGLERRGLLRIVKIGRRSYLRRSDLLGAFDALASELAETQAQPANSPAADYAALVQRARAKRAGAAR
jgi:hypothetical protein